MLVAHVVPFFLLGHDKMVVAMTPTKMLMQFYSLSTPTYRGAPEDYRIVLKSMPPTLRDYEDVIEYAFPRLGVPSLLLMPSCGREGYSTTDWQLFCSVLFQALKTGAARHFAWLYHADGKVVATGRLRVLPGAYESINFRLYLFFVHEFSGEFADHMDMARDAIRVVLEQLFADRPAEGATQRVPAHAVVRFKGAYVPPDLSPNVCLWWQQQASTHPTFDAFFQFYSNSDAQTDYMRTDLFFVHEASSPT